MTLYKYFVTPSRNKNLPCFHHFCSPDRKKKRKNCSCAYANML